MSEIISEHIISSVMVLFPVSISIYYFAIFLK